MPKEITDEVIKKKHKEFNDRIRGVLGELRPKPNPFIQRLKDIAKRKW